MYSLKLRIAFIFGRKRQFLHLEKNQEKHTFFGDTCTLHKIQISVPRNSSTGTQPRPCAYVLWLLLSYKNTAELLQKDCMACKPENIFNLAFYRKCLLIPDLEHSQARKCSDSDVLVATPNGCHWVRMPCLRWCWELCSKPQATVARLRRTPQETQTLLLSEGQQRGKRGRAARRV